MLDECLDGIELDPANGLDAGDRRAAREDAPAREQRALALPKDAERPLERRAQAALAGRDVARDRGKAVEVVAQPLGEVGGPEKGTAGGRELDRHRYPLQPRADLGHRRSVRGSEREPGVDGEDPLDKQLYRRGIGERVDVERAVAREGEAVERHAALGP